MRIIVFLLLIPQLLAAQLFAELVNPSFEAMPRVSKVPTGWMYCGPKDETPPDIHSGTEPEHAFGVETLPAHARTYLGLVTRSNGTWEAVGVGLLNNFQAGKTYWMSLQLARSEKYWSHDRVTRKPANYAEPAIFRIWAGYDMCDRNELLIETDPIVHTEWESYDFILRPSEAFDHLILEVFYAVYEDEAYNGNLLIDDISAIYEYTEMSELDTLRQDVSRQRQITNALKEVSDTSSYTFSPEPWAYQSEFLEKKGIPAYDRLHLNLQRLVEQHVDFEADEVELNQAYHLYVFEHHVQQKTLRQYITSSDLEQLAYMRVSLEQLGLEALSSTFNKAFGIVSRHRSGAILSNADYDYFNTLDNTFATIFNKAAFVPKRKGFIKQHIDQIDLQLETFIKRRNSDHTD